MTVKTVNSNSKEGISLLWYDAVSDDTRWFVTLANNTILSLEKIKTIVWIRLPKHSPVIF